MVVAGTDKPAWRIDVRHVLVFQLARFGDIVQSKRLLGSIAAEDDTQVHLCVAPDLVPIAGLLYPYAHLHGIPVHGAGGRSAGSVFADARRSFTRLRDIDFSEVYLLNYSPLSFACAALFPPDRLRGYGRVNGQDMRGRWADLSFNLLRDRRFAPINLVDFWAGLHRSPIAPEAVNPVPSSAKSGRIGIVLAGRDSRRSLPAPILAQCVQAVFQARQGPTLVCIGAKNERPLVHQLSRHLPAQTVKKIEDRTGSTNLTDLPELLLGLDVLLTPDTGTMHLAAHLGVPVQAFFLSSAWCFETGPYGLGHTVWQALQACSPCRESAPCAHSLACLAPFAHEAFLAHLSGKYAERLPDGLLGCVSALDALGVRYVCVDGEDPYAAARVELRSGLREYLGISGMEGHTSGMSRELGEFLYTERQWMLPGNWKGA
jgi:ADP-heptose:LPS heptosyltransferase